MWTFRKELLSFISFNAQPHGVMVAQLVLVQLVEVRVLVGLPIPIFDYDSEYIDETGSF